MAHTDPFQLKGEPSDELQLPHPGKSPAKNIGYLPVARTIDARICRGSQIGMVEGILCLDLKFHA